MEAKIYRAGTGGAGGPAASPKEGREIATRLVNTEGRFISEATVYRILKGARLLKPPKTKRFPAGKEYQVKTQKPDDYSRMILAWKVQP